jgi:imidazolonepropionase
MNVTTDLTLWRNARLATMSGSEPWGMIENGAVLIESERIAWVGTEGELPIDLARRVKTAHDIGGTLITPGLIDCHTHLVYGGHRANELELRLHGVSYEDVGADGGGCEHA